MHSFRAGELNSRHSNSLVLTSLLLVADKISFSLHCLLQVWDWEEHAIVCRSRHGSTAHHSWGDWVGNQKPTNAAIWARRRNYIPQEEPWGGENTFEFKPCSSFIFACDHPSKLILPIGLSNFCLISIPVPLFTGYALSSHPTEQHSECGSGLRSSCKPRSRTGGDAKSIWDTHPKQPQTNWTVVPEQGEPFVWLVKWMDGRPDLK